MNARLLYLCFSCDFDFLSLIFEQVEDQGVPADVDEVQGKVTGYDSDTPDSAHREQAAPAKDEDESMPEGLTADQSEIMLRKRQKRDSNSVINRLRIEPKAKSRFKIPLCWLRTLPLVRPINEVDVQRLENEFVTGYCDGERVLYVSIYNDKAETLDIMSDMFDSWSSLWQSTNNRFEASFVDDPNLAKFSSKMFYVWEGNHRVTAWWRHVNNFHRDDEAWNISVHCIVLDPQNETSVLLDAMNDINWYAFNLCLIISLSSLISTFLSYILCFALLGLWRTIMSSPILPPFFSASALLGTWS